MKKRREYGKKGLTKISQKFIYKLIAEVVKLVDAVDSKSTECKLMPVRVRPSAPFFGGNPQLIVTTLNSKIYVAEELCYL